MKQDAQLSLFPREYPFERAANRREANLIATVFEGKAYIQVILADVIDLYPYKAFCRHTGHDAPFQVIGASGSRPGFFYMMEAGSGSIYLLHNFSTFPTQQPAT